MADKIRVLLGEEEVNKRINEVAEQINKDYAGKDIHLICIIHGFYVRIQLRCRYCIQRCGKNH